MSNKYIVIMMLLIGIISCKEEKGVVFDEDKPLDEIPITGTKWAVVSKDLDDKVDAMLVYQDKLFLSIMHYNGNSFAYSAEYDGKNIKHHYQSLGNSFGFDKLRSYNDKLYLIGNAGYYCVYEWLNDNPTLYWEGYASTNTKFNDFIVLGNEKVGATSIDPFIRTSTGTYDYQEMGDGFDKGVYALTTYKGELIAGGAFTKSGSTETNGIAIWDGTAWQPLGDGLNGTVANLVVYDGKLIAQGKFEKSGTKTVNNIAMWDGSTWSDLDGGLTGGVNVLGALRVVGKELVVGGDFDQAGSVNAEYIATWNGESWSSLPSGVPGIVGAIEYFDGQIYISNAYQGQGNFFLRLE